MNTQLQDRLFTLYKEKKYPLITQLMEEVSARDARNLWARYCSGTAYLFEGDFKKGLEVLREVIDAYYRYKDTGIYDTMARRFVGYTALQLAQLSAFFMMSPALRSLALTQSHWAARAAREIALEVRDEDLSQKAAEILERQVSWSVVTREGKTVEGVYPLNPSPLSLQVEPTNCCNLKCSMCPRSEMSRPQGFIEPALVEKLLESWSYKAVSVSLPHLVVDNVTFTDTHPGVVKLYFMGEPLLHPSFCGMIRRLRAAGVCVLVQTNGILLDDARLRRQLLDAQPTTIGISIDGISPDTYESIRAGSRWPVLVDAIKALYRERQESALSKKITISVSTIVPDDTSDQRQKAETFLDPLKPFVDLSGFVTLSRQVAGAFLDTRGVVGPYERQSSAPYSAAEIASDRPFCNEALEKLTVLWDGSLVPCCYDYDGRMVFGNVAEGIDTVWQSARVRSFQKALLAGKIEGYSLCRSCKEPHTSMQ